MFPRIKEHASHINGALLKVEMSVNDFNEDDVIDIEDLEDTDIIEGDDIQSSDENQDFSELSGSDDEDDDFVDENGLEQIMEYLNSKGTKVSITAKAVNVDVPNGQGEDEGSQFTLANMVKSKKLTVASEFAELSESTELSDIAPIKVNLNVTGDLDKDLVLNYGESIHEFNTRSQITRALVAPPYNLDVGTSLIAGKIWVKKALFRTVYSDRIEKALMRIQQKAL